MKILLLLTFLTLFNTIFSQDKGSFKSKKIAITKENVVNPKSIPETYDPNLINHEAPLPGGESIKSYILEQKSKIKKLYPSKKTTKDKAKKIASSPLVGQSFPLEREINGNPYPIYGGIPNDNTMAVSDSGLVLLGVNSVIYAYDLNTESVVFTNATLSLQSMAAGSSSENYYDPKIIYDKEADRFILVFLKDNAPATSKIIICFSTTNNPNDAWNVYSLPGNPLNNNRWTDFPAISVTDADLFITGNLIVPNVSWQIGFDGSVIWQIEKQKGYNGDATLNSVFYDDIKYGGNFIRNLHPVQGADGAVDELFLLSNRNFDLANDSVFVLHVEGASTDATTSLSIDVFQSDVMYGMPPNGRQFDTDTSDVTSGLQTNDARVLGAIKIGDNVQFVSNTVNPLTGYSAIYHGTVASINSQPSITANIIGDVTKDYGYPNIAWTGNEPCDIETMISFNYTSFTDFPGISCIYHDNYGDYSDEKVIVSGENYIDRLSGTYERWGDYFGLQRYYKKPGSVFSFGYYALSNRRNSGYCAELISPDSSTLTAVINRTNQASMCKQDISLTVSGGFPPYSFNWKNDVTNSSNTTTNVCLGDSVEVEITDSRGCFMTTLVYGETIALEGESKIYPNPFVNRFAVQFNLDTDSEIIAKIYDVSGKIVTDLIKRTAKEGLNELVFSTLPLNAGNYVLKIEANGKEIVNQKIVKNE
ncbi:MAG: T9SS type A sorting domain-containing protein [Vicingaceae bacterium]|nr:T9SS type A sorting domain-containing protein [Vicingaceae bacterium]